MAKEGLEAAGELQKSGQPGLAALMYCMLGESFTACCQHVKGMELMQLAMALAKDAGDRPVMGKACCCSGICRGGASTVRPLLSVSRRERFLWSRAVVEARVSRAAPWI